MTKNQSSSQKKGPQTPAAIKAAPKGTHQVAAGTMTGPKGRKLATGEPLNVPPVDNVPEEQREGERRQAQANAVMQFSTGTLTTPAAHTPALTEAQQKKAEYDVKMAALAAEYNQPLPAVKATKAATVKNQRNGITRPAPEGITGKVWAAADACSAANGGSPATIAQVKGHHTMKGVNEHTVKTQYSRWRQYHGVKGRLISIKDTDSSGVVATHEGNP